jgi:sulfur carrier protein ThiS adenylyltransferase
MNLFEEGLLRYLSVEQLAKLEATHIGIAGVGGLGSNIANALVRTGFKSFEIIDYDLIDASNLNRQNYFLDEIGQAKVDVTAKRLKQINPDVSVSTSKTKLDSKNIGNYFGSADIVFEAFDTIESKALILEVFGNTDKLLIMGSGMAGISNRKDLKIHQLRKNVFVVGDGSTQVSQNNPPLAPRVIACASLMASVAIEQILLPSG